MISELQMKLSEREESIDSFKKKIVALEFTKED